MGDVGALLRLFGSKRRDAVPRRGISGWIIVLLCGFALSYALACSLAFRGLTQAFQAGRWNDFAWTDFLAQGSLQAVLATAYLASLIARARSGVPERQLYAAAHILRFVAASNDESLAHSATWLLDELRNEPVPAVPAQFRPLPPITASDADGYAVAGSVSCVVGALFAVMGPILALASISSDASLIGIGFGVIGVAAIVFGAILLCIARHARRPLTVSADEQGLRWTSPGRGAEEVQIRWSEARSFFLVQYIETVPGIHRHVAFVLDAPDTTLIWDERTTNKPEALGVSDALCALILARTNLPLRDLTGIAVKLASPRWKPAYANLPTAFWQPLPGDDPTAPILPVPTTRWKLTRPALYVAIPMLLIIAVLSAVGFILPH
jgi:hypothetical protein